MENASKALLIAGAILLAIFLISIGVIVIKNTGSVTDQVGITSQTIAVQTFNARFISYEGKEINASQIKSLFNLIKSSNSSNGYSTTPTDKASDKYVYLDDAEGNITNASQLSTNKKYSVSIAGYSSGGYVNVIKINANSSGGNPPTPENPPIPEEPPKVNNPPVVTVEVKDITESTATIVAIGNDEDGDLLKYTLSINEKVYGPSTKYTWDITELSEMTTYPYTVKVTDGYDTVEAIGEITTIKGNTAPSIVTNEDYKNGTSKTTKKFTIRMRATDADGDSLTYKLLASTSQNGTYYEVGTTTGTSGTYKTIAVTAINGTSLQQYTQYWWKLQVTDGNDTVTSLPKSLRTYCPGTGRTCYSARSCPGSTVDEPCSWCSETGTCNRTPTRQASASYYETCDLCGVRDWSYLIYCGYCGCHYGYLCANCGAPVEGFGRFPLLR